LGRSISIWNNAIMMVVDVVVEVTYLYLNLIFNGN
jgi:hypothetical protein